MTPDEFAAEVAWIVGTDTPDNIARRLGFKNLDNLVRRLRREGRHHLINRLVPEPLDARAATLRADRRDRAGSRAAA
jgi:hypothetical protein